MDTKVCNVCNLAKPLKAFDRNCKGVLGRTARCKTCDRTIRLARYRAQPLTRAKAVWYALTQRIGNANGKNPSYAHVKLKLTKEQFLTWYVANLPEFFKVYGLNATPSVDRMKNNGDYRLGNIRLIPNSENARLASRNKNNYAPPGQAWCTFCKCYLPVTSFHKNKAQKHGYTHRCKTHAKAYRVKSKS